MQNADSESIWALYLLRKPSQAQALKLTIKMTASAEISDESVNTPAEASSDLEKIGTVQKLNPACSFQIEKPKFKIT